MNNTEVVLASIIKALMGITIVLGGAIVGAFFGAIKAPFYLGVFDGDSKSKRNPIKEIINQTKDKL
jgi:hypothetical protein